MALLTNRKVLIVAAHCDDIELGCGGTIVAAEHGSIHALIFVGVFSPARRKICETNLEQVGVQAEFLFERDCALQITRENIRAIEDAIKLSQAEIVVTHALQDTHQDHRNARLMVETAIRRRPISLIEMDSPSTAPDWCPNCWQPIDPLRKGALLAPYWGHVGEDIRRWWGSPSAVASVRGIPACERFKIIQWWEDNILQRNI